MQILSQSTQHVGNMAWTLMLPKLRIKQAQAPALESVSCRSELGTKAHPQQQLLLYHYRTLERVEKLQVVFLDSLII